MPTPKSLPLIGLLVLPLFTTIAYSATESARVHAIAMHGTPKYGPDFKHFEYVNPDAPKGGTVRLAAIGSFDSLNQFIIKGQSASGIGSIYDSLTVASADEPFTRYGLLAESMEVAEDRSWISFKLREEARWHDGKPITADDVIFTFDTVRRDGAPQLKFYFAGIKKIEKISDREVKFIFVNGENRELALIVGEQAILPKHYWEGRDFTKTSLDRPLGSGPYRIADLEAGRFIVYERVDDYWGQNLPVNIGRNNYGSIRYDYYRDTSVIIEAFKAGEFDFRNENSSKHWATAYNLPEVENGLMKKEEIKHNRPSGMQGYVYNTRRPLFEDPLVREALAYAFDYERSNRTLFYNQYTRSRSYFQNSELEAKELPGKEELKLLEPHRDKIPARVFTTAYHPPKTDGTGRIRRNLGAAVKLLKQAGWNVKDGQLRNDKGEAFEFEIMLVSPLFERITLPFTKNLERLGIKTRVRTIDTAQYIKRLETFDFDVFVFAWGQSLSPGNEQLNFWSSQAAEQAGSQNFAGIKDPVVDELIGKIISAPDRESLIVRARALDRVLQWNFYVIPHWHLDYDRLVYWNKFGRPEITPIQGAQFGTWWVDKEKEEKLKGKIRSVAR